MAIERLQVRHVRNLEQVDLQPATVNLIYGANGSGKTSLLEAIHILGMARSFRSHKIRPVIQHDQPALLVQANLSGGHRLGVERTGAGKGRFRLDGATVQSVSELAHYLPLQLFNAQSFLLLEGPPQQRRHYLDWGVFHVEQAFLPAWRRLQTALKQRNAWLRHGKMDALQRPVWDQAFVQASEAVDDFRRRYLARFQPLLLETIQQFAAVRDCRIDYQSGWREDVPLAEQLTVGLERDRRYGATQVGAHRCDLRVTIAGRPAAEVLSRGQQKMLVSALRLAQAHLFEQETGRQCLFLLDDLPAELDARHRSQLAEALDQLQGQVFVTGVEASPLRDAWHQRRSLALFHVEQGRVVPEGD